MIPIKTDKEIIKMRAACSVAAWILDEMSSHAVAGITTYELDCFGRDLMKEVGAVSAAFHYGDKKNPYPAYSCISLNDEVVHGIASPDVILKNGDIVSIDVAIFYDGFVGDNTRTVRVGEISGSIDKFVRVTEEALSLGIERAVPGNKVGDISHAIETHAVKHNYGILRDFVGHGVGRQMHEEPQIPNYGRPHTGPVLMPGMTLAIEPMFTLGSEKIFIANDGWTVKTVDGSIAAHCEHTILVTNNEPEVLTLVKK